MIKAYKLVRRENDKFVSFIVTGEAKTIYNIGEPCTSPDWLRNEGYYPLLFDDIDNLWRFTCVEMGVMQNPESAYILTCECDIPVTVPQLSDSHLINKGKFNQYLYFIPPVGTVSYKITIPMKADHVYDFFLSQPGYTKNEEENLIFSQKSHLTVSM